MSISSRRLAMLVGVTLALSGAAVAAPAASADVVFGSSGSTLIWVGTGAKDYAHHTQWVSYITVENGAFCPTQMEAWTAGFYASRQVCGPAAVTWYISRWVPSGNAVCGSSWVWSRSMAPARSIACIGIRV